ncbi:MAG: ABC transporter ATP-binding protein [Phenylobacterium sp.]|uniref:ABC transporter ATP-binding protein n=1 Tax=Phenylobacterium sp. TaxID=1871053 RepID=UPI002727EDBD|nr:ABC transporter ATP-binding protein [Phenylobacterium sp.]MDO8914361.1 ABC transporter ATP-binding protein [Phenylobacterium sp.]MDO9244953.1 ABC transporter ATP-binding protein [Phenylobacterium sp.]MDP3102181.1 ABC transporter ATP-binding protein [Phenylobacterium sp.]MDP3631661.1 ABC transporter ATP-binding protein [Phenylobacterium sp.]
MDSSHTTPAFDIRGLSKVYRTEAGEVHALRGVDLQIAKGETLVLLGPSGSGKSTLLNILGGLDRASSGSARFHDLELTTASDRELTRYRRASVGFIFQFFNLVPSLTARENVALITEISRDPMPPEEALARVGLAERLDHFPAQLSGGEQQRVAVARAIAKRPELLFCDEPTGSLDSESGVRVLEAIAEVTAAVGATTMIVSHNTSIGAMADRVIRFRDGQITEVADNPRKTAPREMAW